MITVFDSSNYAQQVFLNEAYAFLKSQGNILNQDEIDAGGFLSLDGYFAHIADLVSIQPNYVLIPSDEEPFEIDANSRTIKVPAAFSKCAGVVGDNMCEVATFTIDRYFDYVDLANSQICIQWQAGDKKGISHIGLRDLNTVSGKIRFGWPLTDAITEKAGNVTFAVRFYVEKAFDIATGKEVDMDTADPATTKRQFVYFLNTLPATIPIREGLNIMGQDGVSIESGVDGLFAKFISNSNNPTYVQPQPVSYVENLDAQTKIDKATNTLTLSAQATTKGDGWITYKWFFRPGATPKDQLKVSPIEITTDLNYAVDTNVYVPVSEELSKLPKNKQYYYTNVETGKHDRIHIDENGNFVTTAGEAISEDAEIFERVTTLTIKNTDYQDITGLYYVEAKNSVGTEEITVTNTLTSKEGEEFDVEYKVNGINSTPALPSVECYLPLPAEVEIKEENNLLHTKFTEGADGSLKTATLEVKPEVDAGNPDVTYSWYKFTSTTTEPTSSNGKWIKPTNTNDYSLINRVDANGDVVNSPMYSADAPGWYWVNVLSELNRDTETLDSNICRVVNHTEKVGIKNLKFRTGDPERGFVDADGKEKDYSYIYKDGEEQESNKNGINAAWGKHIELIVEIDPAFNSLLKSDDITYKWYYTTADNPNKAYEIVDSITEEDKQITPDTTGQSPVVLETEVVDGETRVKSVNSPRIVVRCDSDTNDLETAAIYYCLIQNTLNNEVATWTLNDLNTAQIPTFDIY